MRSDAYSHNTVDDVVVRRRLAGDTTVPLTIAERRACVMRLHARGLNDQQIARRIGISGRTVLRIRQLLNLPAQPPPPRIEFAHGTLTRYRRDGCRCDECRTEAAAYHSRYMRLRRSA